MSEGGDRDERFAERVGDRARRHAAAQDRRSVLSWLGAFGMVGWSVAVPTVAGAALGVWLDETYPSGFSWTLTLLFAGLLVGSLIAWGWVRREGRGP